MTTSTVTANGGNVADVVAGGVLSGGRLVGLATASAIGGL